MRIYSWNVNGLRAGLKRETFQEFVTQENPDILCLQETKMKPEQAEVEFPEYQKFWCSAERAGYSGTAIFTKVAPVSEHCGFLPGLESSYAWQEDKCGNALTEGRIQTLEFPGFYLVNVYVPNAKPNLARLKMRENVWDPALLEHLRGLEKAKPVVVCGDFNVAATPLDLARPKENVGRAGFTEEERQGMKNYLAAGLVDSFRYFYPAVQKYTWWSHWANARANNVGWRIDYFLVSQSLAPLLKDAGIHDEIMGSDHCPISLEVA